MLLLTIATALGLVWVKDRWQRQQRAVSALEEAGATVYYDWQLDSAGRLLNELPAQPPAPAWLRWALSDEPFQTVRRVHFTYLDDFREPDPLDPLIDLPGIRHLVFLQGTVRDQDLRRLASLQQLQTLELWNYGPLRTPEDMDLAISHPEGQGHAWPLFHHAVTDHGVAELTKLPHLRELKLSSVPITDAGLGYLEELATLESLDLAVTPLCSESGRRRLASRHPQLEVVDPPWATSLMSARHQAKSTSPAMTKP